MTRAFCGELAELAIAPVLKTGARKGLGVRVPHSPPPPFYYLINDRGPLIAIPCAKFKHLKDERNKAKSWPQQARATPPHLRRMMRGRFGVVAPFWKIIRLGAFKIDTSYCPQSAIIVVFIDFLLRLKFILR
jgi:hypothetical protein